MQDGRQAQITTTTYRETYARFNSELEDENYGRAIELAIQAHDEAHLAKEYQAQGKILIALAGVLGDVGSYIAAENALDEASRLISPYDPYLLNTRGTIHLALNRPRSARASYLQAIANASGVRDAELIRGARFNLVEVDLLEGDLILARKHLSEVKFSAEKRSSRSVFAYFSAFIDHDQGKYESSLETAINALNAGTPLDWGWRIALVAGKSAQALDRASRAEVLFKQSITFVEELLETTGYDSHRSNVLSRKRAPYERLFVLYVSRQQYVEARKIMDKAKARSLLDAMVHRADQTVVSGRVNRTLAIAGYSHDSLNRELSQLRKNPMMGAEDDSVPFSYKTTLISFFFTEDKLWRSVFRNSQWGSPEILSGSVMTLQGLVAKYIASDGRAGARRLSNSLLAGLPRFRNNERIVILPDQFLNTLPFAHMKHRGDVLINQAIISYAPTVGAVRALASRDIPKAQQGRLRALVVGDGLRDSPGARRELSLVAKKLGTVEVTASAASIGVWAGTYDVAHYAGHSGIGPQGAFLRMADGDLLVETILATKFRARTVVLASCLSATETEESWLSIGHAFLAAGSGTVVGSLRPVKDHGLGELMQEFYSFGGADDPAKALALVQRKSILKKNNDALWLVSIGMHSEVKK